jgi:hypothetical protein
MNAVGLYYQLLKFAEANEAEAEGCVVGEDLRRCACEGAAEAVRIAAGMIMDAKKLAELGEGS